MRGHLFSIILAVISVGGCCYWAPWVQGPGGFQSGAALGFAPIWTSGFRLFPGARVDLIALGTHIFIALLFPALIGFGQAVRRNNP